MSIARAALRPARSIEGTERHLRALTYALHVIVAALAAPRTFSSRARGPW